MEGRWGSHPQYGKQFAVENYTTLLPATIQGIRRYLGSGLVKGIGPVFADRITQHFGMDTLKIIEEEPKRLIEVPGLGPKRTRKITDAWEEQKAIKEVMLFLQTVEVSTSIAVRIYKKYGDASIAVVKNQPYRLASEVWGIGFLTADKIAQSVGIPHDSPERVKAGLQYALSQSSDQGHCYLPEERLIADAVKLLQVDTGLVIECLAELAAPRRRARTPASYGRGCRARTATRSPSRPSISFPSTGPNSPYPPSCCACCAPARTACQPSGTWPGTRRWPGCGPEPAPTSPPSRRPRSSWR